MSASKDHGKDAQIRVSRVGQLTRLYFVEFLLAYDCRALSRNGRELFSFTVSQALIITILIEHLEQGITKVPQETILGRVVNEAGNTRLRDYFREHPAWGTFIKTTGGRDASVYLDFNCLI